MSSKYVYWDDLTQDEQNQRLNIIAQAIESEKLRYSRGDRYKNLQEYLALRNIVEEVAKLNSLKYDKLDPKSGFEVELLLASLKIELEKNLDASKLKEQFKSYEKEVYETEEQVKDTAGEDMPNYFGIKDVILNYMKIGSMDKIVQWGSHGNIYFMKPQNENRSKSKQKDSTLYNLNYLLSTYIHHLLDKSNTDLAELIQKQRTDVNMWLYSIGFIIPSHLLQETLDKNPLLVDETKKVVNENAIYLTHFKYIEFFLVYYIYKIWYPVFKTILDKKYFKVPAPVKYKDTEKQAKKNLDEVLNEENKKKKIVEELEKDPIDVIKEEFKRYFGKVKDKKILDKYYPTFEKIALKTNYFYTKNENTRKTDMFKYLKQITWLYEAQDYNGVEPSSDQIFPYDINVITFLYVNNYNAKEPLAIWFFNNMFEKEDAQLLTKWVYTINSTSGLDRIEVALYGNMFYKFWYNGASVSLGRTGPNYTHILFSNGPRSERVKEVSADLVVSAYELPNPKLQIWNVDYNWQNNEEVILFLNNLQPNEKEIYLKFYNELVNFARNKYDRDIPVQQQVNTEPVRIEQLSEFVPEEMTVENEQTAPKNIPEVPAKEVLENIPVITLPTEEKEDRPEPAKRAKFSFANPMDTETVQVTRDSYNPEDYSNIAESKFIQMLKYKYAKQQDKSKMKLINDIEDEIFRKYNNQKTEQGAIEYIKQLQNAFSNEWKEFIELPEYKQYFETAMQTPVTQPHLPPSLQEELQTSVNVEQPQQTTSVSHQESPVVNEPLPSTTKPQKTTSKKSKTKTKAKKTPSKKRSNQSDPTSKQKKNKISVSEFNENLQPEIIDEENEPQHRRLKKRGTGRIKKSKPSYQPIEIVDFIAVWEEIDLNEDETEPKIGFKNAKEKTKKIDALWSKASDYDFGQRFFGRKVGVTVDYLKKHSTPNSRPPKKTDIRTWGAFGVYEVNKCGASHKSLIINKGEAKAKFTVSYVNKKRWLNLTPIIDGYKKGNRPIVHVARNYEVSEKKGFYSVDYMGVELDEFGDKIYKAQIKTQANSLVLYRPKAKLFIVSKDRKSILQSGDVETVIDTGAQSSEVSGQVANALGLYNLTDEMKELLQYKLNDGSVNNYATSSVKLYISIPLNEFCPKEWVTAYPFPSIEEKIRILFPKEPNNVPNVDNTQFILGIEQLKELNLLEIDIVTV